MTTRFHRPTNGTSAQLALALNLPARFLGAFVNIEKLIEDVYVHICLPKPGEILFFPSINYRKELDLGKARVRYSHDLDAVFGADHSLRQRMPSLRLRGLHRIALSRYSKDEQAKINMISTGCVDTKSCSVRRMTMNFIDGRSIANIYVDLNSGLRYAVGPEGQYYDLADYDIRAVALENR